MTSSFPSTSEVIIDIPERLYNLAELGKVIDGLKGAQGKLDSTADGSATPSLPSSDIAALSQDPSRQSLFHLHRLSVQATLSPPPEQLPRWHRGIDVDPNPAFGKFTTLRGDLRAALPPASPRTVIPRSRDVLHVPVDIRGKVITGATTPLVVLLPSKLKRANRKPFIQFEYPYTQGGAEWAAKSTAWDMQNWMHAALALDPAQPQTRLVNCRPKPEDQAVILESEVQICWIPDRDGEEAEAEVQVLMTVDLFLDMEKLFVPLPDVGNELLGLVLHSLIPAPTIEVARNEGEARAQALRRFFACLKPAPGLPNPKQFQPPAMVSTLLPFQLRTVGLLVAREGGHVQDHHDPRGFWTMLDLGKHGRMAYRRVTGELVKLGEGQSVSALRKGKGKEVERNELFSQEELDKLSTVVDLSNVKGTMLCEEMGLGKTVEAIALSMLHRHPTSVARPPRAEPSMDEVKTSSGSRARRQKAVDLKAINLADGPVDRSDPVIVNWWEQEKTRFKDSAAYDEQSQLNIAQVAATLIVTPPSLLKQWISEIHTHAPGVRVCVYEGWKTLQKVVEKYVNAATRERQRKEKLDAKRKRTNDILRRQTIKKYQKGADGRKVKIEPDSEDEFEPNLDEDEEEGERLDGDILETTQRLFVDYVRGHDIVITTYGELTNDLTVAHPAPPRSRRTNVNYRFSSRPRSPLVMVEWWRVIMDEVQLCGDTSNAAEMVSLVPRRHSLAVSGTPARTDIKDLMGSLRFLRVPTIPYDNRLWHRLQQAPMREAFEGLFQSIAVRTTKQEVANEFHLPTQTRMIVPIELSEIELHYYNDTLDRQRFLLGLPTDPSDPRPAGWILDRALFRTCLTDLRQICTHIQVGIMHAPGRKDQRLQLGRELMTMDEALEKMRKDHAAEFLVASRIQLRAMIRKAQLLVFDEGNDLRYLSALALHERVRAKVDEQIVPIRRHLQELLKDRADLLDDDESEPGHLLSQQEREHANEISRTRLSLRETLLILHQSWFFEGDVHHTKEEQEAEVDCYNKAEVVRKEILERPLRVANLSVEKLMTALAKFQAISSVQELQLSSIAGAKESLEDYGKGMLSHDTVQQATDLFAILDDNAVLVHNWRIKIIELLKTPIDSEAVDAILPGESTKVLDPEKEYYAEALQAQGDVESYLIAYAAAVADRKEMMLEERSTLIEHDYRAKNKRQTRAAQNAELPPEIQGDVAEQASVLLAERQVLQDARRENDCERPLKALLMDLNVIVHGPNRREEIVIAEEVAKIIKEYIAQQKDYYDKLARELEMFRATFNRRVIYFAALQEISDSVVAPEFDNLQEEIDKQTAQITVEETKLARLIVKGRFLTYLGQKQGDADELREDCIICMGSSDDHKAVLLECGHFFCTSCFKEYRRSATGRKCPQCRTDIDERHMTRVKLGGAEQGKADKMPDIPIDVDGAQDSLVEPSDNAEAIENAGPASQAEEALDPIEVERLEREEDMERLKVMTPERRREIALMDMMGEYGSKIDFLIKHLLWYRSSDPKARHVIFSNWSDSLNIVIRALHLNGIKHVAFDQGKKGRDIVEQFIKDESITVFLLHAEKESSGLTLTACRVVHLLEPVLKHSFELQAIGRVDRLGQKEQTTVYCYATRDTVESRILSQGVRNGTSIYLKDDDIESGGVREMPNVVGPAHKGGDVSNDGKEEELLQLIL